MKLICPDCGTQYDSGKFCQECGAKLQEVVPELVCPSCGYKAKSGKFCPECGAKLTEQIPAMDSAASAEMPKRTFNERDPRFAKFYDKKGFPRAIPQEERAVAKEELIPYAEQGVAEAKMLLSSILLDEYKNSNDTDTLLKCESLIHEAENSGDKFAYYIMGMFYLVKGDSNNIDEGEKRILELYNENQDGDSAQLLAELYAYSDEKRDYQKAFEYATIAAEEDEDSGYQVLGALYLNGWGVEKDLDMALENYTQAAALGDEVSMNQIGYIYLGQEGSEPNPEQAFYWFNEASKKGDDTGMYNLGCCYREGFGVEADAETAAEWFKKSADLGNVSAMKDLGDYYQAILLDNKKAKRWYTKAAEVGDAEAQNKLSVFCADKECNYDEALKWCHKAMEQDNAWAYRNYANFLWNGNGCEVDKEKAIEMMQTAASLGLLDAEKELKEMQQAITEEAMEMMQTAASLGFLDAEKELKEMQQTITEEAKKAEVVIPSNELHIPEGTNKLDVLMAPDNSEKNWKTKIEVLYLPDSVTSINQTILQNLPNLRQIVIPNGQLSKFGKMLPYSWWMMYYCNGYSVCPEIAIPNGQLWIYPYGVSVLSDTKGAKDHVLIPPTCSVIEKGAFEFNNNILSVTMTDSVTSIEKGAFATCKNLQFIRLSASLRTIPKCMVEFCKSLKEVKVPEGVYTIEQAAFSSCKSLERVILPSSVYKIDKGGTFGSNPFQFSNSLREIVVPIGTKPKFQQLLNGFSGNPAKFLVEARAEEKDGSKNTATKVSKTSCLPMDEIIKAANASYAKQSLKNIAVATLKIAEVIQERLPDSDVSYQVYPHECDNSVSQNATPIQFLFKKNGMPKVAVVAVTESGHRTFRVKETQDWCERNGIEYVKVYADGNYSDWITGWSGFTHAPVTSQSVEFCKNWLVEKISKHL